MRNRKRSVVTNTAVGLFDEPRAMFIKNKGTRQMLKLGNVTGFGKISKI